MVNEFMYESSSFSTSSTKETNKLSISTGSSNEGGFSSYLKALGIRNNRNFGEKAGTVETSKVLKLDLHNKQPRPIGGILKLKIVKANLTRDTSEILLKKMEPFITVEYSGKEVCKT